MTSPHEEGDPASPLLVLAEAPSYMEMRMGRPLTGPSGEVFNDCLHKAGLIRRQLYILNLWPFKVTKDKMLNVFDGPVCLWKTGLGFTEDGLEAAQPALDKIRASKANVILTLGQIAMTLLMGESKKTLPIMKWRGSPLWSKVVDRKFIPTVHPAATIHGAYLWRYLIISDMEKVDKERESSLLELPKRDLMIAPTFNEVAAYVVKCKKAERFATDIEVMNHQVSCFSLSCDPSEAMTVPLLGEDGISYWNEDEEARVWGMYANLMADPLVMKVNQNIVGFDIPFLLLKNHIHTKGPIGDTMIAQHIMYPDFPKGLDFIASMHTREPYWKDDGKIWKQVKFDWDTFQGYCAKDSAVALEAWDVLAKEMDEGGYWPTYNRTVRMAGPLAYMSIRGLKVDEEGLEETKIRLTKAIENKEAELTEVAEYHFNTQSPKQCAKYFYDTLGIRPYVGKTGGISTDDKAMTRIYRKGDKGSREAKIVQELRALKKLKGTYIDVTLDDDKRLRCSWNPRGTWTGRLSSSQTILDTGLNLQNLHPEFKGFIVAG